MNNFKAKNNLFSIILREKKCAKGISLYFEIRERSTHKRYYEFLNEYLTGEPSDIDTESKVKRQAHLRLSELTKIGYYSKDAVAPKQVENFTDYFRKKISEIKKENSRKMPSAALKYLQKYCKIEYIPFAMISEPFLIAFKNSMKASGWNYFNYALYIAKKAQKEGLIIANILLIKQMPQCKRNPVILTEAEILQMQKTSCQKEIVKQAALLQFATTQRISDVSAMRWEHVIKEKKIYRINIVQKKTSMALPSYVTANVIDNIASGNERSGLLFPKFPTKLDTVNKCLNAWAQAAGVSKHIGTHTFRRSAATLLYKKGVHLVTISKILGHSKIETTMKYIGVTAEDISIGLKQIQVITANFEYKAA